MYSNRVTSLEESATIAISTLARELKAQGKDILSFSAGEPDFETPQAIKDEAFRALNSGFTHYTAVSGTPELLKAIANKLKRDNALEYDTKEILVSNGAKHSLFNVFAALVEKGDEVIIPAPYWVTYPELVKYNGGQPIIIDTDESTNFKITPKNLKSVITPKTKILVLTTPSNPTGMVYTKEELEGIAKVLKDTKIWVISDEIYEKLLYGVKFTSVASISEDMLKRTITINGLSKSVAMTGWRMGYLACKDKKLVKMMTNLQSQTTSNINSITQQASIVALRGDVDRDIEDMRIEFEKRLNYAIEKINSTPNISVVRPMGAFYLFINIKEVKKYGGDSMKFCEDLLNNAGVALVPGVAFGADGYVRFSFACSLENIQNGLNRIAKFVAN